jgi:hypothetical protein
MSNAAARLLLLTTSMLLGGASLALSAEGAANIEGAVAPADVVAVWQEGTWGSFGGGDSVGAGEFPLTGFKNEALYDDPTIAPPHPQPFTPIYAAKWKAIRHQAALGRNVLDIGNSCAPLGIPFSAGFGEIQFLFAPDRIVTTGIVEGVRIIYMDGRPHQKNADASFNGDSIGHWEGKTLVIDTVNLWPKTFLEVGMPHSDALHVIERWQYDGPSSIKVSVTIDDPKAFTMPLHESFVWHHDPKGRASDGVCENNRDLNVNGATTMIGADGKPLTAPPPGSKAHYKVVGENSISQ